MNKTVRNLLLKNSYINTLQQQKKTIKRLEEEVKELKRTVNELRKDTEYKIELIAPEDKYEELLHLWYRQHKGRELDFDNLETLDDKIQWLKLNRNSEKRSLLADKYRVREFVIDTIGKDYLIPLLGVYDKPEDIPFRDLPDRFVVKANHGCAYNLIVKDKSGLNISEAIEKLKSWLSENYAFKNGLELQYAEIERKLIVEQYIEDNAGELNDYKFYCFGPHVECVVVCLDRGKGKTSFYLFDREWNLLRYNKAGKKAPDNFTLPKPDNMDLMFELAGKLSEESGEPFVRVDLYNCDGKIFFGEMTFTPASGADKNRGKEADQLFGKKLNLQ